MMNEVEASQPDQPEKKAKKKGGRKKGSKNKAKSNAKSEVQETTGSNTTDSAADLLALIGDKPPVDQQREFQQREFDEIDRWNRNSLLKAYKSELGQTQFKGPDGQDLTQYFNHKAWLVYRRQGYVEEGDAPWMYRNKDWLKRKDMMKGKTGLHERVSAKKFVGGARPSSENSIGDSGSVPYFLTADTGSSDPIYVDQVHHLIILKLTQSLLYQRLPSVTAAILVRELVRYKKNEGLLFFNLRVADFHVPKTVPGLLHVAGLNKYILKFINMKKTTKKALKITTFLKEGVHGKSLSKLSTALRMTKADTEQLQDGLRIVQDRKRSADTPRSNLLTRRRKENFLLKQDKHKQAFINMLRNIPDPRITEADIDLFDNFWAYLPVWEWYETPEGAEWVENEDIIWPSDVLAFGDTVADFDISGTKLEKHILEAEAPLKFSFEMVNALGEAERQPFVDMLRLCKGEVALAREMEQFDPDGDSDFHKYKRQCRIRGLKLPANNSKSRIRELLEMYEAGTLTRDHFSVRAVEAGRWQDYQRCYGDVAKGGERKLPDPAEALCFYAKQVCPQAADIVRERFEELDPTSFLAADEFLYRSSTRDALLSLVSLAPLRQLKKLIKALDHRDGRKQRAQVDHEFEDVSLRALQGRTRYAAGNQRSFKEGLVERDLSVYHSVIASDHISSLDVVTMHKKLMFSPYIAAFDQTLIQEPARVAGEEFEGVEAATKYDMDVIDVPYASEIEAATKRRSAAATSTAAATAPDDEIKVTAWQPPEDLEAPSDPAVRIALRNKLRFDNRDPVALLCREFTPAECKVHIRNVDPNLTPYDILEGLRVVSDRVQGIELYREHLLPQLIFRRKVHGLKDQLAIINGNATVGCKMKWNSSVYGWLYFDSPEAAEVVLDPNLRLLGVHLCATNVALQKVDKGRINLPGIFSANKEPISCSMRTRPATEMSGLWVGNIPEQHCTPDRLHVLLYDVFSHVGLQASYAVSSSRSPDLDGDTRYACLLFKSHDEANAAFDYLSSGVWVQNTRLAVAWLNDEVAEEAAESLEMI